MPAKPPDRASGKPSGKPAALKPVPLKPVPLKTCPICGKPATETSKPFCSERCRDVDLNRWLSGSYAIPGKPEDEEDAE
jgi:uncharacterized protein